MSIKQIFVLLILCLNLFSFSLSSQTFKKFNKAGDEATKNSQYDAAIEHYTKALELKPDAYKTYLSRAWAYLKKNKEQEALKDYTVAINIDAGDNELILKTADLNAKFNDYSAALEILNKGLQRDGNNYDMLIRKSYACIKLKKFKEAEETAEKAIFRYNYRHEAHYYKALALDSLKDYPAANLEYSRASVLMWGNKYPNELPEAKYKAYFTDYASCMVKVNVFDEAMKTYSNAIKMDPLDTVAPKNYKVWYLRSLPALLKGDYNGAIGDLNKAIVLNPNDAVSFLQRAKIYQTTSNFQSAINDYTKVLLIEEKNTEALSGRGKSYAELNNYKPAITDLTSYVSLNPGDEEIRKLLEDIKKKDYEANKELDAPELKIEYPVADNNGFVNIYTNQLDLIVEGFIKDKSPLLSLKINDNDINFITDEKFTNFKGRIPVTNDLSKISITVTDIYNNTTTKAFKIGRIIDYSRAVVTFAGTMLADNEQKLPVANQTIYLTNEKGERLYITKTDANGKFKFENLPYDKNYMVTIDVKDSPLAEVDKFIIANESGKPILASSVNSKQSFKFDILPMDYKVMELMTMEDAPLTIDFKGRLVAGNNERTPLSNVNVIFLDENGSIVATQTTDGGGGFVFANVRPIGDYSISIDPVSAKTISYDKIIITDPKGKIIKEVTRDAGGMFKYRLLPEEKTQLAKISEIDPWIKTLNLSKDKNELVIIENIYYESGSVVILQDAEPIINKAINAMKSNPKIILEIQSHTDAVAGDDFNLELSQKRASTVIDYIASKGIDKKRLSAKGFGESQIMNRCANGVECSDEEHKQNRRTVFKINYIGS